MSGRISVEYGELSGGPRCVKCRFVQWFVSGRKKSRMAVVEPNLDLEKEVDKASAHTEPHISTGIYF